MAMEEGKSEKKNQQRIPFFRGICKKSDHCNYEHQVDSECQPIPVGQEFLQRKDDAIKRASEAKAQNKAKVVPREGDGVTSAMIVLEKDTDVSSISRVAIQVSEDCYDVCGDIAEGKVSSSMVHKPIVQGGLSLQVQTRLVVALQQSVILISKEWFTTSATWKLVAQAHGSSNQVIAICV